jgi:hypothetical protein
MKMKRFPIGIFLMLFIIESLVAGVAVAAYFLYAGKSRIEEMESYTRSYSISLADAFASVAELGYRTKKNSHLKTMFREKIEENIIAEAFFVLKNGRIIAHSDKERAKQLKGNIASDEFSYNLDLILRPVRQKSREVMFSDYDIINTPVSYGRNERMMLKRYLYPKIDSTGWLASKAVFIKKKPVGAVGFIISKEKIYSFIAEHIEHCKRILIASLCLSFVISLAVSLVVLLRYRSIQKKLMGYDRAGVAPRESKKGFPAAAEGGFQSGIYDMTLDEGTDQVSGQPQNKIISSGAVSNSNERSSFDLNRRIKDAIEVVDQE